jgi:hypothetical protein
MTTVVTVTSEMLRQMKGLLDPYDFCDDDGHVIGRFTPAERNPSYEELLAWSPYTEDELQQQANDSNRSIEQILRELRAKRAK